METRERKEGLKGIIIKKIFVFLIIALGIPTLGLELCFAIWGKRISGAFQEIFRSPTVRLEDQLPRILEELNSGLMTNMVGWVLQLIAIIIAYYGSLDLWIRSHRAQEIPPLWKVWIHSLFFSLTKGSLAFLLLLSFVGPIQLWSLYLGGFFVLAISVLIGSLLLMAPVILKVNPSMGFIRAIPHALFARYSRPPIVEKTQIGTTITNLSLLYMVAYGFFGLSFLGDKIFMNFDSLPLWLHTIVYSPSSYLFELTPAYILSHLWGTSIKIILIGFITHTTVNLYFSIPQRKKITEI